MSVHLVQVRLAQAAPSDALAVHVIARTREEVTGMALRAAPQGRERLWSSDWPVDDEHYAVNTDTCPDGWRLGADVVVGSNMERVLTECTALIGCEFDPRNRWCTISSRGLGRLRFTASATPDNGAIFASASAFAASFVHAWLVTRRGFSALRDASLEICCPEGEVTLVPSDRITG